MRRSVGSFDVLAVPYRRGRRPPHLTLYAVGAFKLANLLVNLGITAYTERWSALAPAGVLM